MKKKLSINSIVTSIKDETDSIRDSKWKSDDSPKAEKRKTLTNNVSIFIIFRYATWFDVLLFIISTICSIISGILQTFMFEFFGTVTGHMVSFGTVINNGTIIGDEYNKAEDEFMYNIEVFAIATSISGFITVIMSYISILTLTYSAIRQISKIRSKYMEQVLNQDISWYDVNQTGDFTSRITEDLGKIEEALGDKLSTFIFYMSIFASGVILALVRGWELALICLIYLPVSTVSMALVSWLSSKLVMKEMDAYGSAGSIAGEVLGSVRTVIAFDGQQKEIDRYKRCLGTARKHSIKRAFLNGISNGTMWLFVYGSYALSFYYGVMLIIDERDYPDDERVYTPSNMVTIFFCVLMATWNFTQCAPFFQVFTIAKGAASKIFSVIDNTPIINASKNNGKKLDNISGTISFENVHFLYPSRPDVKILQGLNLTIKAGETVALVGSSGCGKSTCIQMIQRFYDPIIGRITLDNVDIKELDLRWLRGNIGVVGQEPVLFGTSIKENIRYGNRNATTEDIEAAMHKSNSYSFIKKLPQGYDTLVGERGAQLSGGQKQRIAIARALVREPSILLLDEATSALDTSSEAQVQDALDNASKGCTTIIVAHRLSTIRGVDRIVVINEGNVIEDGSHEYLMKIKGAYFNLVNAQISTDLTDDIGKKDEGLNNDIIQEHKQKLSLISDVNDLTDVDIIDKENVSNFKTIWEVMKLNKPEWWKIILACIGAAVVGAGLPLFSIVFGDVVGILSNPDSEYVRQEGNRLCMLFAIIGVATGIGAFIQWYMFGISGEKLTMRVRSKMFETMLKQEMGWFDKKENGVGALCSRLSTDASGVQGASGTTVGTIVNCMSSIGLAVGFSLFYEWRLTLVIFCFVPLIFLGVYLEQIVNSADTCGSKNAIENSTKLAVEAISNVRTVASLGCENLFHSLYLQELGPHYKKARQNTHMRGVIFGLARSIMFFTYATSIYYGGVLIRDEKLDYSIVFKISEALITSAWSVGNAIAFTPNFQKGIVASVKIFKLFGRKPEVRDIRKAKSISWANSNIEYKNIQFSYPTRPAVTVLKELNLSVFHGKTVALVGPSGCGKSTIIQLLERFYDPKAGSVSIDDQNINTLKLSSLRSHLGIVSQEPNLFDRTISENIAYGDNARVVMETEIIQAAKNANIHNFIISLPLGYETRLGEKGTQLSGGQKQRIAIARALVRNPQVLLLDEATSALDTESEKIVQEALDNAKQGRTCITIAHRLLTIQDADVICVIDNGQVSEMGTHSELLNQKGLYHKLYSMQMRHR